jgi:hypothetical protein
MKNMVFSIDALWLKVIEDEQHQCSLTCINELGFRPLGHGGCYELASPKG